MIRARLVQNKRDHFLFLKRRENREREREREKKKEREKTREGDNYFQKNRSPLVEDNEERRINEEEEEEDGESPVKIPVRAEKDRRVPRGRGDG